MKKELLSKKSISLMLLLAVSVIGIAGGQASDMASEPAHESHQLSCGTQPPEYEGGKYTLRLIWTGPSASDPQITLTSDSIGAVKTLAAPSPRIEGDKLVCAYPIPKTQGKTELLLKGDFPANTQCKVEVFDPYGSSRSKHFVCTPIGH